MFEYFIHFLCFSSDGIDDFFTKSCIFINLAGAPSQLDTFDPKDGPWNPAGADIRQYGSLLLSRRFFPMLSGLTSDLCILRSVTSWEAAHTRGQFYLDTYRRSWGDELNRPVMQGLRERRLVFHGLRKSAVVTLLEAGATDAEVSAITGQSREMVAHYSRQVNQRKLAAAAILKWEASDGEGGVS